MFSLKDSWVWDFWTAKDGDTYHLFFLYASRALHDPDRRHYRASIGHAISHDLVNWERIEDALVRADAPAFDDLATWTGSVVQGADGVWNLFYTGATMTPGGNVQRIGRATSTDLRTFTRVSEQPILEADARFHEVIDGDLSLWHDQACRDPWVFRDPEGDGWHMLVTVRAPQGEKYRRAVVGHAWSADLESWEWRANLSEPISDFGQLEVLQSAEVDGKPVVIFCCMALEMVEERRSQTTGGIWAAPADSLVGPFHFDRAYQLTDSSLYAGKLVQDPDGQWCLMGFHHDAPDGSFVGAISDPMPVVWQDERLVLA